MHPYWNHIAEIVALIYAIVMAIGVFVFSVLIVKEYIFDYRMMRKTRKNDRNIFKVAERGRRDFN